MTSYEFFLFASGVTLAVMVALQAMVIVSFRRALKRLQPVEERVTRFGDALSLLTETTETGFRAVSTELERLGAAPAVRSNARAMAARMIRAARQGESLAEIAASEQVSEGEVRLRLHLAEAPAAIPSAVTAAPTAVKGKPRAAKPRTVTGSPELPAAKRVSRPARRTSKVNGSLRA